MNGIDAIGTLLLAPRRGALRRLPAAFAAAAATWLRLGRESRQLQALDGRDLHDLAISRIDALQAAHQSRWPHVRAAFHIALNPEN